MNFYLSAVDDLVRQEGDGPSIGLILCKSKNRVIVESGLPQSQHPDKQKGRRTFDWKAPWLGSR